MMSKFKSLLLAGTIAMLPLGAQAHAAPKEAPVAETVAAPATDDEAASEFDSEASAAEAKAKMQKEMDAAIAIIEKMFDTSSLPPVEPARLALAQKTTAALIPNGSIEKMVDNLYGRMFKAIMGEMGGESDLMLSIKTGVDSEQISTLDDATKGKVADLFDPYRKEREDQITKLVKPLLSEALADMEPPMRGGLAKAYARKFTGAQLTELNAFLATPTGALYASEWMALQADPEVMVAVVKAVPPLITKFIDRAPQIEKDFKELPKEKELADLDDKELAKLATLMKVDVKLLEEQRDMWKTDAVEAVDAAAMEAASTDDYAAAEAAADAAAAAVDDPAYDRGNWSATDLKRVEDLEAAYENASLALTEANEEAVANARKRLPPSTD